MGFHSPLETTDLESRLKDRMNRLLHAVRGRELAADEVELHKYPEDHRWVDSRSVRLAVDEFSAILKEVKKALGKS